MEESDQSNRKTRRAHAARLIASGFLDGFCAFMLPTLFRPPTRYGRRACPMTVREGWDADKAALQSDVRALDADKAALQSDVRALDADRRAVCQDLQLAARRIGQKSR
jgi:hypothetical protein